MSKHSERVTKQLISMQQEVLALRKENERLKQHAIDLKEAGQTLFGLVENMDSHADLSDYYYDWIRDVKHKTGEILADEEK